MTARLLKDPSTAGSRVFVGHLQTDDTNKAELEEHFSKYGKVVGSLINRGFGFVQFETEDAARSAIQKEDGAIFKSRRIDVRPAKKDGFGGGPGSGSSGPQGMGMGMGMGGPQGMGMGSGMGMGGPQGMGMGPGIGMGGPQGMGMGGQGMGGPGMGGPGMGGPGMGGPGMGGPGMGGPGMGGPGMGGPGMGGQGMGGQGMGGPGMGGPGMGGPGMGGPGMGGPGMGGGPMGGPGMGGSSMGGPGMGGPGMGGGPMGGGPGMGRSGMGPGGPGMGGGGDSHQKSMGPMNPFGNNQFAPQNNSFGPGNQNFDRNNQNFGGPNQMFNNDNMQSCNKNNRSNDSGNDQFDDDIQEIDNSNDQQFSSNDQFNNGNQNRGGNNQFGGNQNRGNDSFGGGGNGGGNDGPGGGNNGPANNQNRSGSNQNNRNQNNQSGNQNQAVGPNGRARGSRGGKKHRMKNREGQGGGNNSFRDRSPINRGNRGNDDKNRDWDRQGRDRNFGRDSFSDAGGRFDDFKGSAGGPGFGSASDAQNTIADKNDCEIIVVNKILTEYAEMIEMRLKKIGLSVDLLFPNEDVPLSRVLGNIASRGCLYAVVVTPINMEHHSLTLNILHGLPQEHRNMPVDDAITLMNRDFGNYKCGGRSVPLNTPFSNERHPDPIQVLVNMLADNHQLTVLQYDRIIKYLEMKRDEQIQIELGDAKDVSASSTIGINDPKQAELQSRILNILNSNKPNANVPIPSPVPAPAPIPPTTWALAPTSTSTSLAVANATGVSPSPLLNDPTVQKALDSLLQGNLLKNIGEPQSAPAPSPLFAAFPYIGRF